MLMTLCLFWKTVEPGKMKNTEFIFLTFLSIFWLPELAMLVTAFILLGPFFYFFRLVQQTIPPL